jgi:hypothetical protein
MSLIIKKNTTFKIPRTPLPFLPSSLGGLALWLKADAGVTKDSYTFISSIEISGTSIYNGTYSFSSEYQLDLDGDGVADVIERYYTGPGGTIFNWGGGFELPGGSFNSSDGVTWTNNSGSEEVVSGVVTYTTENTDNVTAWEDQSGNGKNATPLTVPPTLTTINSKSFISFNGVDQALVGANVISALPCTIISVLQVASYLGEDLWFEQYDAQDYIGLYANGDSFGWTAYNGAAFGSTDSPWPTNTTQLATTIFDGANSASFHNGSLAGTGDSGDRTPAGSYYLSYFVPVDSYKNYKIAEIIVYNRAITTPERQQVETYLNQKYQIY